MATYRVDGMTCGGCANSVIRAVQSAADGAEVSVDLEAKTVTVSDVVAPDTVAQAVGDAGFEFGGPAA